MFLWALCYPLISIGLENSPPLFFAFLQASMAGIFLLIIGKIMSRPVISDRQNWKIIFAIGFTATTLGFWGMFYAGGILSPGLATVLTNTQPIMAAGLGWYLLNEKIGPLPLLGLLAGFLGIVMVSFGSLGDQNPALLKGIAYVLIAALGIALSNVLMKQLATRADIINAMGWQLLIGALPLGLMSLFIEYGSSFQFTKSFVLSLFALSLLGTSLPFVLWFWLLQRCPLNQINIYTFLTPIIGLAIGYLYFAEMLLSIQIIGAFVVIIGVCLVNVSNGTHQSSSISSTSILITQSDSGESVLSRPSKENSHEN